MSKKLRRLQILQPVIPHYRLPFFRMVSAIPGWDVLVSASASLSPEAPASVDIGEPWQDLRHPARKILGTPLYWQSGMKLLEGFGKGDVLVVVAQLAYLSTYPLMREARRRGGGVVWWGHGHSKISRLADSVRNSLARYCDVVLLYYKDEAAMFLQKGFRREDVFSIGNAIDQGPIQAARAAWPQERLTDFKRREGLEGCKVLLYCARISDMPRLTDGITAFSKLFAKDSSYRYLVIGSGPLVPKVKRLIQKLDLQDSVRLLGGIYREEELAPWFLSASALFMPRPVGLSLFHAFGYSLPVITHDCINLHGPEIHALKDGENGLLYRDMDIDDIVGKIESYYRNPVLRENMKAAAFNAVAEEYNISKMSANFIEAVERASYISRQRA